MNGKCLYFLTWLVNLLTNNSFNEQLINSNPSHSCTVYISIIFQFNLQSSWMLTGLARFVKVNCSVNWLINSCVLVSCSCLAVWQSVCVWMFRVLECGDSSTQSIYPSLGKYETSHRQAKTDSVHLLWFVLILTFPCHLKSAVKPFIKVVEHSATKGNFLFQNMMVHKLNLPEKYSSDPLTVCSFTC